MTPIRRRIVRTAGKLLATDAGGTPGRLEKAGEQTEQCGLSGAVGPEECERLTRVHAQTDAIDGRAGYQRRGRWIRPPRPRPLAVACGRKGDTLAHPVQNGLTFAKHAIFSTMTDIDVLLHENRKFPPPDEFRRGALVSSPDILRRSGARSRSILGARGGRARVDPEMGQGSRLEAAAREVVHRRKAQRLGELRRPPRCGPRRNKRRRSSGKASRAIERTLTYADASRGGEQVRQRPQVARRRSGRPRRDLPADDSRSRRSRCSRARESARSTRWCSADSRPNRCATGSTTRECKVLITADGGYRRGQIVPLKQNSDNALEETPSIEKVVVVQRWRGREGAMRHSKRR